MSSLNLPTLNSDRSYATKLRYNAFSVYLTSYYMKLVSCINIVTPHEPCTRVIIIQNKEYPVFGRDMVPLLVVQNLKVKVWARIAQSVQRRATSWIAGIRFPAGTIFFSSVQTDSRALLASYSICTRGSFLGGKSARVWSWSLTSIQCRSKQWWGYTSTPQYIILA
jgi:hypothetical protein